jgi:SEC-C motif-containing protein
MKKYDRCACWSKQLYHKCCQPYHQGTLPEDALKLMRSRYCAYALDLADYIIESTHRDNEHYKPDHDGWRHELHQFSASAKFDGLKILEFVNGETTASVTFAAAIRIGNTDASFTERSTFVKENDRWLYRSGEIKP